MHPRNFGSQKIVCTEYVCTYVHPLRKPGWNFEFQVPAHFGPKKQQQSHFFLLNFNVYIGVDIRERARARDNITKEINSFE